MWLTLRIVQVGLIIKFISLLKKGRPKKKLKKEEMRFLTLMMREAWFTMTKNMDDTDRKQFNSIEKII